MSKKLILVAIACLFIGGLMIIAWQFWPCSMPYITREAGDPLPHFLLTVWPAPGSSTRLNCLVKDSKKIPPDYIGIGAELSTSNIDDFSNKYVFTTDIPSRTSLYIDGEQLSSDSMSVWTETLELVVLEKGSWIKTKEAVSYRVFWSPQLPRGKHEAIIRVINNKGKDFDFTWEFSVK